MPGLRLRFDPHSGQASVHQLPPDLPDLLRTRLLVAITQVAITGIGILLGELIIRLCDAGFGAIETVRRLLGRRRVETISTSDLRAALNSDESAPVLVDVRSVQEQAVSRIPGAITQHEYENQADDLASRRVVAYCTVGGRSYLFARRLVAGGTNASNYRDSILGWCRAGLPLESSDGKVTNDVHPYWRIFHVPVEYKVKTKPSNE